MNAYDPQIHNPRQPDPIDIHVGARVRLMRTLLGLTQHTLADELGLTFQQVQKYERGANRISASRLYKLAQILNVPISYFFEDMSEDAISSGSKRVSREDNDINMTRRETLELVRAYYGIESESCRRKIIELARELAHEKEG